MMTMLPMIMMRMMMERFDQNLNLQQHILGFGLLHKKLVFFQSFNLVKMNIMQKRALFGTFLVKKCFLFVFVPSALLPSHGDLGQGLLIWKSSIVLVLT